MSDLKSHIDNISSVLNNRAESYGSTVECFNLIASSWSQYLGCEVSSKDVAVMMCLLKIARHKQNQDHVDSLVDLAGYAILAGVL